MIINQHAATIRTQPALLYWIAVVIFAILVLLLGGPVRAAKHPKQMLSMDKVKEHTLRFLRGLEDYEPGDMLARGQIEPLFRILYQMGWNVSDKKSILKSLPADRDFLFQKFQSPEGKKFMRQISKVPTNFERLDRLIWNKGGHQRVLAIMKLPDGPQLTEAIESIKSPKEIGHRLSTAKGAANSYRRSSKIYNATQLLERLAKSHAADTARATQAAKKAVQKDAAAN